MNSNSAIPRGSPLSGYSFEEQQERSLVSLSLAKAGEGSYAKAPAPGSEGFPRNASDQDTVLWARRSVRWEGGESRGT